MRRAGKVDDFLQENWVNEDGDVVDELEAAGHEEAEAKADDQWAENWIFFGKARWLNLYFLTSVGRKAEEGQEFIDIAEHV